MEELKVNVTSENGEVIVRHGEAGRVYEYNGFQHKTESTESFIRLVKAKANQPNCVVAYNENEVRAIMDDTVKDRNQDEVFYPYQTSIQYQEWQNILNRGVSFDQKEFIEFLKRREANEINDIELIIAQLQNFKYVTTISGDFTYDNNNNYTFAVKIGEAETSVRLPSIITANIEVYNESGFIQPMEIEIEVKKARSENEKPSFVLTCPKIKRYMDKALKHEVETIKAGLDGFLIVAGRI